MTFEHAFPNKKSRPQAALFYLIQFRIKKEGLRFRQTDLW